jgi:hypothetical protein
MRQIVRLRKMETHDRQEMEAILETLQVGAGPGLKAKNSLSACRTCLKRMQA